MGDSTKRKERRRELREREPTHVCSQCMSVQFGDDERCLECGAQQPGEGWTRLDNAPDTWLGKTLGGRYLTTKRIGRGASGSVYRAESLSISRQFAIKVIDLSERQGQVDAKSLQERLNREIAVLGTLRNPHIVSFYDAVRISEDAVALVMDLINGSTVEALITDSGSFDVERAAKITRQVANGLHEAHESDMIHRDLKPENIMIERLPAGDDFVHILDFGVVRREGDSRVTQGFLGTPLYASPEQVVGEEDVDRRSDIYSLGGVLFFMLTGRPPYLGDTVFEVLRSHVQADIPQLSEVVPDGHFPGTIQSLLNSMLAKEPDDRPETLATVIEKVDRLLSRPSGEFERQTTDSFSHADSVDSGVSTGLVDEEAPQKSSGEIPANAADCEADSSSEAQETVAGDSLAESDDQIVEDSRVGPGDRAAFKSGERDNTGPKAAIFNREQMSPTGAVRAIESAQDEEARDEFSDRENLRRNSGMFSLPGFTQSRAVIAGSSPCAERVVLVGEDGRVRVGCRERSDEREIDVPIDADVTSVALAGDSVLAGDARGRLHLVEIDGDEVELLHENVRGHSITTIDAELDGRVIVFATSGGAVYLFDRRRKNEPSQVKSGSSVDAVAVSIKGGFIAVADRDAGLTVHELASPANVVASAETRSKVSKLTFSNDGYLLAALYGDKRLSLFHVDTGREIMDIDQMIEQPLTICFDEQNQLFGFCELEGEVYGWDLHHHLEPSN